MKIKLFKKFESIAHRNPNEKNLLFLKEFSDYIYSRDNNPINSTFPTNARIQYRGSSGAINNQTEELGMNQYKYYYCNTCYSSYRSLPHTDCKYCDSNNIHLISYDEYQNLQDNKPDAPDSIEMDHPYVNTSRIDVNDQTSVPLFRQDDRDSPPYLPR